MQPPRGTRDFLDQSFSMLEHIRTQIFHTTGLYGFTPVESPVFEHTNVFLKTLGDATDMVGKEMYTFQDKGGESLTLRPEGTASLVRAIISNGLTQILPQKRSYFGPMFRYERPQKGRYRQFYQFGVEYIGTASPIVDAEVIAMASHVIRNLGITNNFKLHLNTLGDEASRLHYREALVNYFSRYVNDLSPESQQRLHMNPLRILDSKSEQDKAIVVGAPSREASLNAESQQFYNDVREALDMLGVEYYEDPCLVRGIDYYRHTVFEFISSDLGAQNAFGGGGRYDGLVKLMGGPETPGVGWAMGVDRLMLILEDKFTLPQPRKIAVIPVGDDTAKECLALAVILREQGHMVELCTHGNIGKRFKLADRLGCTIALVMGSDERDTNTVKVKDMTSAEGESNKEQSIAIDNISQFLGQ